MPYIGTRVSTKISKEQEIVLKERLGKIIGLFPGKSERWLMLDFEDSCRLWMGGDNSMPMAYVEVKVFGTIDSAAAEKVTEAICALLEEVLGIEPSYTYVKYGCCDTWGWNKSNF